MTRFLRDAFYRRLTLALLCSFVAVGALFLILMRYAVGAYQDEVAQNLHRDLASHVVHDHKFFIDGSPDQDGLRHLFHNLMVLGPNFEFYLLSSHGDVLAYSADPAQIKRRRLDTGPIRRFLERPTGQRGTLYGPDPRDDERQKVFSAAPVYQDGELKGYMYVIVRSELFDDVALGVWQDHIVRWVVGVFLAGLLFSLIATLWVFGLLTRPLRRLTRDMTLFRARGLERVLPLTNWNADANDEVHRIGSTFNDLAKSLRKQYQQIKSVDEIRRELLSHISHDLRTPLSSMQGYLEACLMNYQRLSPDESLRYIETAHSNSKKLSQLVEQLFELARLESACVPVNLEPIVLAELVQDVLQKFSLQARLRNVLLNVEPKDSAIVVNGDIEKLERVFSNLVENALRHCGSGDKIVVQLQPCGENVSVKVSDSGIGIPAGDLSNIFDAHYKASNSVRGDSAHGGMGLAITKKLLALHQTEISVHSEENCGTAFEFHLQSRAVGRHKKARSNERAF